MGKEGAPTLEPSSWASRSSLSRNAYVGGKGMMLLAELVFVSPLQLLKKEILSDHSKNSSDHSVFLNQFISEASRINVNLALRIKDLCWDYGRILRKEGNLVCV